MSEVSDSWGLVLNAAVDFSNVDKDVEKFFNQYQKQMSEKAKIEVGIKAGKNTDKDLMEIDKKIRSTMNELSKSLYNLGDKVDWSQYYKGFKKYNDQIEKKIKETAKAEERASKEATDAKIKDLQKYSKEYEKLTKETEKARAKRKEMKLNKASDEELAAQKRIIDTSDRRRREIGNKLSGLGTEGKEAKASIDESYENNIKLQEAEYKSQQKANKAKEEHIRLLQQEQQMKQQTKQEEQENAKAMKEAVALQKDLFNVQKQIALLEKDKKGNAEDLKSLREAEASYKRLLSDIRNGNKLTEKQQELLDNIEKRYGVIISQTRKHNNELGKSTTHAKNLGDTLKNIAKYILVYQGLNYLKQGIQEAITTVKELDKAFTDLQMVTGNSDAQMTEMADSYNKLAREMSATTLQVAEGAAEWLRTGKSIEETEDLLRTSMVLSKVGLIESSEATQLLVSTMNGFKLSTEETMGAVDKMVELDMAAATSAQELATALSRTASSAQLAGVSLDNVLAYITTVSSVTRKSAETIGESFKTIFARMGNIKIGKFTDDETGENLNDVEATLNKIGIALRSSQNEFRETEDVLSDLATKWENLNDVERNAVAVAIAGKNRVPEYTEMYSAA